jgi:hypothetical protein
MDIDSKTDCHGRHVPVTADTSAQLYRSHAYYAAKVAATMPFNVLAALIFSFIVYGMAGLRPGAQYIWQNGILNTLLSLISVQVSMPKPG